MSTASRCFSPFLKACCRKSLDVSTIKVCPACSIKTETRRRLSRGSSDVQVSQSQAIEGTPVEVPVPKKVSRILVQSPKSNVCSLIGPNGLDKSDVCCLALDLGHWTLDLFSARNVAGAEFRRRRRRRSGKGNVLHSQIC